VRKSRAANGEEFEQIKGEAGAAIASMKVREREFGASRRKL